MTPRDRQRLAGVHPLLKQRIEELAARMETAGHPVMVVQGLRTLKQQQALYAQGRTTKGPIVTKANGVPKAQGGTGVSDHQAKADGYGWAVDLAFVGPEPFAESHPWALLGQHAMALGLDWGGAWTGTLVDRPHVALKAA